MPKPASLTVRIAEAACESALPPDARHVVMVMSLYAEHETASGFHGQATIARLTGRSERHVRSILANLSRLDSHPIRIERRARFRADGRGRTSDEWRLVLVGDQPAQPAGETPTNRHDVPAEEDRLTGTPRTTNRHATSDQPAPGAGDPLCDPPCEPPSSIESARERRKGPQKRSRKLKELPWPEDFQPTDAHRAFAAEHGLDVELEATACSGHYEGKLVASPNGRFKTWLANLVRWNGHRQNGNGRGRWGRLNRTAATTRPLEWTEHGPWPRKHASPEKQLERGSTWSV